MNVILKKSCNEEIRKMYLKTLESGDTTHKHLHKRSAEAVCAGELPMGSVFCFCVLSFFCLGFLIYYSTYTFRLPSI